MAMFVLVVDTLLMNVSISAVIRDLHTTASGVQSAIALEALISAAFILTNSKLGDLMGRRRAYVIGLLAYAVGAVSMVFARNLNTIVVFWAIVGGMGASLLLPAMQSLIHGNFTGSGQKRAYALVGASAAIAAAIGPLLGLVTLSPCNRDIGTARPRLRSLTCANQREDDRRDYKRDCKTWPFDAKTRDSWEQTWRPQAISAKAERP